MDPFGRPRVVPFIRPQGDPFGRPEADPFIRPQMDLIARPVTLKSDDHVYVNSNDEWYGSRLEMHQPTVSLQAP